MVVYSYYSDNSTSGTTTITADDAWYYWCSDSTSDGTTGSSNGNSITADGAWYYWNLKFTLIRNVKETEEEQEERLLKERERQLEANWSQLLAQKQKEHKLKLEKMAEKKAIALLEQLLTPEEAKLYHQYGRVLVKGKNHDYLISKDTGHVRRIEKDRVIDLCMHMQNKERYAPSDNVICMKLFIENEEEEFNRRANYHGGWDLKEEEREFLRAING